MLQMLNLIHPPPSGDAQPLGTELQGLVKELENHGVGFSGMLLEHMAELLQGQDAGLEGADPAAIADDSGLQQAAAVSGNSLPPEVLRGLLDMLGVARVPGERGDASVAAIDARTGQGSHAHGGDDGLAAELARLLDGSRSAMMESAGDTRLLASMASRDSASAALALDGLLKEALSAEGTDPAGNEGLRGVEQLRSLLQAGTAPLHGERADGRIQPPPLSLPVQHPRWGDEVGQRLSWMINHAIKSAEIQLDPPDLGPMRFHLKMEGDQVQLAIQAHHHVVRDALEQNLPRLREFLAGQGMNLVQVDVSQHGFSGQQGGDGQPAGIGGPLAAAELDEPAHAGHTPAQRGNGLVDTYA